MINQKLMAVVFVALASPAAISAQVISTGTWTNVSSASIDNNPLDAFWDRRSDDGAQCNIGHYLSGSFGTCANMMPIATAGDGIGALGSGGSFLGAASLGDERSFSFAAGVYQIDFFANIAGYSADNGQSLVAYIEGGGTETIYERQTAGGDPIYTTILDASAGDWFFGANSFGNGSTGDSRFSNAAAVGEFNRFAIFSSNSAGANPQGSGTWYVGFEDSQFGDSDFNDLILRVSSIQGVIVPEPASAALLLFGFGAMGAARYRRRSQS